MKRKILIILLAVFMLLPLTGCKEKTKAITSEEFNQICLDWFKEDISADYLSFHFGIADPSVYQMEKPEVTLGAFNSEEDDLTYVNRLTTLKAMDTSNLTSDEVITYKSLVSYYELMQRSYELETDYGFAFTPNSGLNNNLVTNYTEFVVRDEQDAIDLIALVNDTGRYFDEAIDFTRKQAEDGIVQFDFVMDSIVEQCERFIEKVDDNEVILAFNAQLANFNFDKEEEYKQQMADAVKNVLIPAYERVIALYNDELKPQADKAKTMSNYGDEAKKYYEVLFAYKSSSSTSIDEYRSLLNTAVSAEVKKLLQIYQASPGDYNTWSYDKYNFGYTDSYEILTHLKEEMTNDFPAYPEVDYTVNYLDPSVTSDNIAAYYLIAPVDDVNVNVIKANPNFALNDANGYCSTLAHEGYPGHLYQHTYFFANHPNSEIRYTTNFMGYSEGWAVYVESFASGYFKQKANIVALININEALGRYLYVYCDLLINYYGYGVSDIEKVIDNFGLNGGIALDVYQTLVGDPCIMTPYGLGLYNMTSLRNKAKKAIGNANFDNKEFNTLVLDAGETSFDVLTELVDKYIETKTKK